MAVVDYFLKIGTIKGESQDKSHKDEIQLESWSFGASQAGASAVGGGGGAGKVQMQDFHFVMKSNKAGPLLFLACANGEHIDSAQLTCRKAGKEQREYLKVYFKDVLVSSYQFSGSGGADILPLEQISLNFAAIKVEYQEQKADGTLGGKTQMEYNLKKMEAAFA